MKAQLSFDYYFSLVIFSLFVATLFFRLLTFFPFYSQEVTNQQLRSEAYQVSEILINYAGYPGNWYTDVPNAKVLGLSDETKNKTHLLSKNKITAFDSLCSSNYNKVTELLAIGDGFSAVLLNQTTNPPAEIMRCLPAEISVKSRAEVKRIVSIGSSYGELTVQVWKK